MDTRQQRGLAIAALFKIDRDGGKYVVPSQSGDGRRYTVDPEIGHCTCPDHEDRKIKCKHLFAVEFTVQRDQGFDGTTTITKTITVRERVTYKQNWPAYNKAQTTEKHHFLALLADLCRGIDQPPFSGKGRPRLSLADMVFSLGFKIFSTVSGRRFMCDLADAQAKGYIDKVPHFNSVYNYLEMPELTPVLSNLIAQSSLPLRAVETDFAVDSSGFSTCRFIRWFDIKYGKPMEEREWVKVHLICGVKTNVVTAVEIRDKHAGDAPLLAPLVKQTAKGFTIKEVSADGAYTSTENLQAVIDAGGTPYMAFKENTTGGIGGVFAKCFHYYSYNRDEFLTHYHKRSNVESTFSMVKAKFGDSLRSKTDVAMTNEALCKILCHNLCCLIQSVYELKISPKFWEEAMAEPAADDVVGEPMTDEDVEAWGWV